MLLAIQIRQCDGEVNRREDNRVRARHDTDCKNCEIVGGSLNQLNRCQRTLLIARINIYKNNFGVNILNLTEDRIGWPSWKSSKAEDRMAYLSAVQTMPEHWQAVFVFCQERNGYALHGRPFFIRILVLGNGMALQNVRQVTLVLFTILRTDVLCMVQPPKLA